MAGAVILREQHALGGESLRKVSGFRIGAEGDVIAFVFENDYKDVFYAAIMIAAVKRKRRFSRTRPGYRRARESREQGGGYDCKRNDFFICSPL